ncbi:hypothetical protein OG555_25390 [Kribbella sp. NBC_01484]|uniref:hypothetical protein n=1 Tax=Kribbella sp. NBC_01484 TaxID=2903579 RepID=UPI002E34BAEB|nr:hypothetical protein [Kribbella sp. NBC_01484]
MPPRRTSVVERSRISPPMTSTPRRHHVDLAGVLELVAVQVEELVGALGAGQVPVGGPAGADDVGTGLAGQLYGDRADGAAGAVDEDGLPVCRWA